MPHSRISLSSSTVSNFFDSRLITSSQRGEYLKTSSGVTFTLRPGWPGTDEVGTITLERETPLARTSGDNSCGQYALLALQSAFNAGVHAPRETWERAARWFAEGGDPEAQLNGRSGQSDAGVDVCGQPDGGPAWAGVQFGNL